MATISYAAMWLLLMCLIFMYSLIRDRNSVFINWPIIGSLPSLLYNFPQIHELVSKLSKQSGGTFEFRGPWFSKMNYLVTSDLANTRHILCTNSSNYTKGPDFTELFEPFGDGIFSVESDSWKLQRKMIHSYIKDDNFRVFLENTIKEKVTKGLFPVLDRASDDKTEVKLKGALMRLGFDTVCLLFLGCDPQCRVSYNKAINNALEAIAYRHAVPEMYWKLLKWLQIGPEEKLTRSLRIYDDFIYHCIASKREEYLESKTKSHNLDFLTSYFMEQEGNAKSDSKFLRDVTTSLVLAGRDTSSAALSWFFWLLATNPSVESKVLEEIDVNLPQKGIFSSEELKKLSYLDATLCETLRLYPPVPLTLKWADVDDTLPSGHRVRKNTKVFVSSYAMGRMEEVWGSDCCEFKPERWMSDDGGILRVPSYKFVAFGAGPRACLGKDMGFVQMKIVAVAILRNYCVRVVEDRPVVPTSAMVLHMKPGLMVRVTKRSI